MPKTSFLFFWKLEGEVSNSKFCQNKLKYSKCRIIKLIKLKSSKERKNRKISFRYDEIWKLEDCSLQSKHGNELSLQKIVNIYCLYLGDLHFVLVFKTVMHISGFLLYLCLFFICKKIRTKNVDKREFKIFHSLH